MTIADLLAPHFLDMRANPGSLGRHKLMLEHEIKQYILNDVIGDDVPIPAPFNGVGFVEKVIQTNKIKQMMREKVAQA